MTPNTEPSTKQISLLLIVAEGEISYDRNPEEKSCSAIHFSVPSKVCLEAVSLVPSSARGPVLGMYLLPGQLAIREALEDYIASGKLEALLFATPVDEPSNGDGKAHGE